MARKPLHGHAFVGLKSRTYTSWKEMKARCFGTDARKTKNYKQRGITVCDRWMDFRNFLSDMGERPEGCSLDRINNDGNYEPGNCRWATRREQQNNLPQNRRVTIDGVTLTISEWSRVAGISKTTISQRIKSGWDAKAAITVFPEPIQRRWLTIGDSTMSLSQWARKVGVDVRIIHTRLRRGWDVERAIKTPVKAA